METPTEIYKREMDARVAENRSKILDAAMEEAGRRGYQNMTREGVASRAGVSPALVSHYYGNMAAFRDAIMAHAVETKSVTIVAQGLANMHPLARAAPIDLKEAAALALA